MKGEVAHLSNAQWSGLINRFDDATLYQTWAYGAVRWGAGTLSHVILKSNGNVLACAQARIMKTPVWGIKIAYIPWGPCWRLHGEEPDPEVFREMVRKLREIFVLRRGLVLRIAPNVFEDGSEPLRSILSEDGFHFQSQRHPYRTLRIDLSENEQDLLMRAKKKWRENLRKALRSGLDVEEGHGEDLYETFIGLYREMHARKRFVESVDVHEFGRIQQGLPRELKMVVMIAKHGARPVSGLVWSAIGDTGIPIFSATSNEGLKLRGSYMLRWRMLERLKELGCRFLDQGGINPTLNAGTYHFKAGMGGTEAFHIGQFEACRSRATARIIAFGESLMLRYRRLRRRTSG